MTELVPEPFGLGGARLGAAPLRVDRVAQAADDDAGQQSDEDPDQHRAPLQPGPESVDRDRGPDHHGAGQEAAHEPEAEGRLGDRDQVERPKRLSGLEREDGDDPDPDERIARDQERASPDACRPSELDRGEDCREHCLRREEPDDGPAPQTVRGRHRLDAHCDCRGNDERGTQEDEPAPRALKHPVPPGVRAPTQRARASSRQGRRGERPRRPVRRRHPRCLPRRGH